MGVSGHALIAVGAAVVLLVKLGRLDNAIEMLRLTPDAEPALSTGIIPAVLKQDRLLAFAEWVDSRPTAYARLRVRAEVAKCIRIRRTTADAAVGK